MKLLFDENLSPTLVDQLLQVFPESRHVDDSGLHGQPDERIWEFAREHGFVIVSKDSDFRNLSSTRGAPPKVVWLVIGNAGTSVVHRLLSENHSKLEAFAEDEEEALLILPAPEADDA